MAEGKPLDSLRRQLAELGTGLKEDEWKGIHKSLADFGDVLQSLGEASKRSATVRQTARDAVHKIKNSMRHIIDETAMVRYCRQRCLEIVDTLEEAVNFQQLKIEDFLSSLHLTNYLPLFKTLEDVHHAGELLEVPIDEVRTAFEPYMEYEAFSKLRKAILEKKSIVHYIENDMEPELKNMEVLFAKSSAKIQERLARFIDDLTPVLAELLQQVEAHDEKRKGAIIAGGIALAVAVGFLALGGIGIALFAAGVACLAPVISGGVALAAGATAGAVGGYNVHKAIKEAKEVETLNTSLEVVTKWQQDLRSQFLQWRRVMNTFGNIYHDLKKDREKFKYKEDNLEDLFVATRQLLWEAVIQTGEFETQIEKLRDKKINI